MKAYTLWDHHQWNLKSSISNQIYLVKVPLNVSIVKQDLLHREQFLENLWSEVRNGEF